jgi:hypothetical protein
MAPIFAEVLLPNNKPIHSARWKSSLIKPNPPKKRFVPEPFCRILMA